MSLSFIEKFSYHCKHKIRKLIKCKFYSRIVLNKLCSETKTCFRVSENILTKCIIQFLLFHYNLNFLIQSQLYECKPIYSNTIPILLIQFLLF